MVEAEPSLTASPAAHAAAADAAPLTAHPVRKFTQTLMLVLTFWPLWIVAAIIFIVGAVCERAFKGAITRHTPLLGGWAINRSVRALPTSPAAPASTPSAPAPVPETDSGGPAF
jgi:hypothetical protein